MRILFAGTPQVAVPSLNELRRAGHEVAAVPGSLLTRTYGAETIQVNSFHHQSLREIAPALKVSATAPDGSIEGVEHPDRTWILGVQWHPEMMFRAHEEHLKPFAALVEQAAKRAGALVS